MVPVGADPAGSDAVGVPGRARRGRPSVIAAVLVGSVLGLGLTACSSSDTEESPEAGTDTVVASSAVPAPSTSRPLPRTPGVDPFPLPLATAGLTGTEVCERARAAVAEVLGVGGTATPDDALSRCTFLRAGVTYVVTLYPYDAYELARANAFQTSDGDIEVTIAKRKATWFAGPGLSASRMLVQMSDLASLLVERNGSGGAETQRAEMTKLAEALLPLFETLEPPPMPTIPPGPVEPLVPETTLPAAGTASTVAPGAPADTVGSEAPSDTGDGVVVA